MEKFFTDTENFYFSNLNQQREYSREKLKGYINEGILETSPELFITFFNDTLLKTENFYSELKKFFGFEGNANITYTIDYTLKKCICELIDTSYSLKFLLLRDLMLNEENFYKANKLIGENYKYEI